MGLIPLFGRGEGYRSRTISAQKRVNLYLEYQGDRDKSDVMMLGTPGLEVWSGVGLSPVRGARAVGNVAYVVTGSTLYRLDSTGAIIGSTSGVILTSSGRVSISDNGNQVMIVDGTAGYIYNIGAASFFKIADADFPNGATTVTFLNGYFIVNKPNTGQFWWSALYDGTSWDGLNFATAEANPDNLVAVTADHGVLFLWGLNSIEFWGASGDTAVWRRVSGAGIEWGVPSPWSIDRFGDDEIFFARNRMGQFQVTVLRGLQPTVVATPDITHDMNQQTAITGATGYSFMVDNHLFYQINFANKSYLYDGLSQAWSELSSNNGRHFGEVHFEFLGQGYVCDYADGTIYRPSLSVYDDNGYPIVREWVSKHVFHDLERVSVDALQVEFEPGVGLDFSPPAGADPQAMLQVSRDGGATFGNEHWVGIGKLGEYQRRAMWRQLGRARDFVFKVRVTDPVKVAITNVGMTVR